MITRQLKHLKVIHTEDNNKRLPYFKFNRFYMFLWYSIHHDFVYCLHARQNG